MDGFVLVHGKLSGPCVAEKSPLGETAKRLLQLGHIVDYVDYSWSKTRRFDSTLEQSLNEIGAAICRVQAAGATKIHIIGHSMGSVVLMYYATLNDNFDTLTLMCPSHNTHLENFQRLTKWCFEQAKIKLTQGIDTPQPYIDFYMGQAVIEHIRPSAYVSFYDPNGNANMVKNAAKMLPKPVLFVIGQIDNNTPDFKELVYDKVAHHNAYYVTMENGTHHSIATSSISTALSWINDLESDSKSDILQQK